VFVDQFEEAFTVCHDPDERRRFVDRLLTAPLDPAAAISVVLAVRADFVGLCAADPALGAALEASDLFLGPMDADDLRQAVEGPARAAGLRLEPGLVDVVLADVDQQPGALPLVSHALLETWRRRDDRTLTLAGYREAGGVHGAIARTADEIYIERFDGAEQAVARTIFVRLTELGEGTEDTRRRVERAEIDGLAGSDPATVARVVQVLADARLIIVDEGTVEVAHEALIREWPRLRGWLDDDREGLRLHRHVTEASREWERLGRPASELYRGTRLEAARTWIEQSEPALTESERAFLDASDARQRADEEAEAEAAAAQVQANRRLRVLLSATAIGLVLALAAGVVAVTQRNRADDEARRAGDQAIAATAGRLAARSSALTESDPTVAVLLALEAVRLDDTPDNRAALAAAIGSRPALVAVLPPSTGERYGAADFRPDANEVAAVADGVVDRWDTFTFEPVGEPLAVDARDVAYSPDGTRLAAATAAGVELFDLVDLSDGEAPASAATIEVEGGADGVAWSPDGITLAVGRADQEALFVSVDDAQVLGPISPGFVGALVEFNRDGTRVAVAGDTDAQVFDTATGRPLLESFAAEGSPGVGVGATSVAFHRLSDVAALATGDGGVTEFDLTTGTPVGSSAGVMVSLDPPSIALGDEDADDNGDDNGDDDPSAGSDPSEVTPQLAYTGAGSQLWQTVPNGDLVTNTATSGSPTLDRNSPAEYRPSVGEVAAVAVTHDGRMLAVAGDGLAIIDEASSTALAPRRFIGPAADPWVAVGDVSLLPNPLDGGFSPDGRVAVAAFVQSLEIGQTDVRTLAVDLATGRALAEPLSGVAQYIDESRLLLGRLDGGSVRLGTVNLDGEELSPAIDTGVVGVPLFAYDDARSALALTGGDGTVKVFTDDGDGRIVSTSVEVSATDITELAVSRGGRLLAVVAGRDSVTLSVYDVDSGEQLGSAVQLGNLVTAPAVFDTEGTTLAVANGDDTVLLVDPRTGQSVAEPIAAGSSVTALAFTADGRELAVGRSAAADPVATVGRWSLEGASLGTPLSLGRATASWLAYRPGGNDLLVGVASGDVLLWSVDPRGAEAAACRVAGRNLTDEEWRRELPGEDYRASCARFAAG
jgi:WD40 repeat protein